MVVGGFINVLFDTAVTVPEEQIQYCASRRPLRVLAFSDEQSLWESQHFFPVHVIVLLLLSSRIAAINSDSNPGNSITSLIVDVKTGFAYLTSALVLLSRDHQLGILKGLLDEFDSYLAVKGEVVGDTDEEEDIELHGTRRLCTVSLHVLIATLLMHLDYCAVSANIKTGKQSGVTAAVETPIFPFTNLFLIILFFVSFN